MLEKVSQEIQCCQDVVEAEVQTMMKTWSPQIDLKVFNIEILKEVIQPEMTLQNEIEEMQDIHEIY